VLANNVEGFWIHCDADVLDDADASRGLPPARRLSGADLAELLRAAAASGRAVGLEVTVYNPRLDEDGSAARALVSALIAGLSEHGAVIHRPA